GARRGVEQPRDHAPRPATPRPDGGFGPRHGHLLPDRPAAGGPARRPGDPMTAPAQEHVRRAPVRGSAALVARSDALARLAGLMADAVADIAPDATADDVARRTDAVEAGVNRCVTILL